jgi:hypothetical protein
MQTETFEGGLDHRRQRPGCDAPAPPAPEDGEAQLRPPVLPVDVRKVEV